MPSVKAAMITAGKGIVNEKHLAANEPHTKRVGVNASTHGHGIQNTGTYIRCGCTAA